MVENAERERACISEDALREIKVRVLGIAGPERRSSGTNRTASNEERAAPNKHQKAHLHAN